MNRERAIDIRYVVQQALRNDPGAAALLKEGTFDVEAKSYSDTSVRLEVVYREADLENGRSAEQVAFELECATYGFLPSDYLAALSYEGTIYRLYGFNSRARKYPCLVRSDNGRVMKVSIGGFAAHRVSE